MRFVCTKENLSHALEAVGSVASKQTNLPILQNVLIQATESKVEFLVTNLEIAVRTTVRAKIETQGAFTVPAKTLVDFVHLLPDEQITLEKVENELVMIGSNSSTKIKGAPADEYPVIPDIEEKHGYSLLAEPFREALGNIVIATAKNEIRPELSGVFFNFFGDRYAGLILAATDSYRLAEKKVSVAQGSDSVQCIVPSRTVLEIMRLISAAKDVGGESLVRLWVSNNQIAVRYDNFEMSSRLIDGKYPDYAQIIPNTFKTVAVFPVDIMMNKIKAASLFATTGVNAVSFDLNASDKTVGVSSMSTQTGEHSSSLDADVDGEENSILLNHRYVLDGLQQMEGMKDVEFKVNGSDVPCLFQPKGKEGYLYIVMPVRQ